MKLARRVILGAVLLASGCAAPRTTPKLERDAPPATVRVQIAGAIATMPLEDYVRVVVLSELGSPRGDLEAIARMFAVQAIVSRTYALVSRHPGQRFDLCSTTHCQVYDPARAVSSRWAGAAADAVRKTTGLLVWFDKAPARVVFHADCGGHTSAARDVWNGEALPYLAGVADDGPAAEAHAQWRFAPATDALREALNADHRTRVGSRIDRIDVLERDAAGRAELVALDGERAPLVRGEELRSVLARAFGARAIRSTYFDVVRTERGFEFTGRGFGHGVGLCQAGALARLRAGASTTQVLAHYFPGTSVH